MKEDIEKTEEGTDLFTAADEVYKSLEKREKFGINLALFVAIILISVSSFLESIDTNTDSLILKVLKNIILIAGAPVIVGIFLSILDRIGILFPVERKIRKEIKDLSNNVAAIRSSNKELIESLRTQQAEHQDFTDTTLTKLVDYDKYYISRHKFGISTVVGVELHKRPSEPNVRKKEDYFIINMLEANEPPMQISYLNSFITNNHMYLDALQSALSKDVHIKMLLMKPLPDVPVMKARWEDCYKAKYTSYSAFVKSLEGKYQQLLKMAQDSKIKHELWLSKPQDSSLKWGQLEVRVYEDSLNHPLVIARDQAGENVAPSVAYTGFYLGEDAANLPYIEWRGGDFEMIAIFDSLFKEKWAKASEWAPVEI